jgi:hypothetical protein
MKTIEKAKEPKGPPKFVNKAKVEPEKPVKEEPPKTFIEKMKQSL